MRWLLVSILAVICTAPVVKAQGDFPSAQVTAANANALETLRQQIVQTPLTHDLTVGEFLDRTDSQKELERALQQARPVGGPRWIDKQVCQVQMELKGEAVALMLNRIASAKSAKSPLPAGQMQELLRGWERRTFAATGASVSAAKIESLRPPVTSAAWATVEEAARRQAVAAARQNAIARTLDSVCMIEMTPSRTVADALRNPAVNRAMVDWLTTRPVMRADFREDRQVELTFSAPAEEVFNVFRRIVVAAGDVAQPGDSAGWDRLHEQWLKRMASPVGRAAVATSAVEALAQPVKVLVPRQPPEWADRQIDADGTTGYSGSLLKTARAAERMATDKLFAQVNDLPLTSQLKLGDAARQDTRIRAALGRFMTHARTYRADYAPDGSVTVRVSLDLRDLWGELRMLP